MHYHRLACALSVLCLVAVQVMAEEQLSSGDIVQVKREVMKNHQKISEHMYDISPVYDLNSNNDADKYNLHFLLWGRKLHLDVREKVCSAGKTYSTIVYSENGEKISDQIVFSVGKDNVAVEEVLCK